MSIKRATRSGFTLIELIVSAALASMLMAGLASTLFIAFQATDDSSTPASGTFEGLAALLEMANELKYAQAVSEQNTTSITVTVPDRSDLDTIPETIRYAWSGTEGDPLTRKYNDGDILKFVDNVHDFEIEYHPPDTKIEYVTLWIQVSGDEDTGVETSVPLLNQP